MNHAEAGILFLLKTCCPVTNTQSHHHEDPRSQWVRCGRDGLVQSSLAQKHRAHSQMDRCTATWRDSAGSARQKKTRPWRRKTRTAQIRALRVESTSDGTLIGNIEKNVTCSPESPNITSTLSIVLASSKVSFCVGSLFGTCVRCHTARERCVRFTKKRYLGLQVKQNNGSLRQLYMGVWGTRTHDRFMHHSCFHVLVSQCAHILYMCTTYTDRDLIITHRTRVAETTGEDRIRFLITHNGGAYFHQVAVENVFSLSLDSSANDDSFEITTLFFFFSAHD